jgi:hypothetical protein
MIQAALNPAKIHLPVNHMAQVIRGKDIAQNATCKILCCVNSGGDGYSSPHYILNLIFCHFFGKCDNFFVGCLNDELFFVVTTHRRLHASHYFIIS